MEKMRRKLNTETDTPGMATRIGRAFKIVNPSCPELRLTFEHGQWWVTCRDGSQYSVVDASGPGSTKGFGFERVTEPDDDFDGEIPPCAASMGCLCAGHARGNPASAGCDTSEVDLTQTTKLPRETMRVIVEGRRR